LIEDETFVGALKLLHCDIIGSDTIDDDVVEVDVEDDAEDDAAATAAAAKDE